jgi:hypothetical protein
MKILSFALFGIAAFGMIVAIIYNLHGRITKSSSRYQEASIDTAGRAVIVAVVAAFMYWFSK